ncbi:hypothetical protein EV426DRAFT_704063 [Tirmania nivea]|nr:hypothetical protein EV426DRAFT_704063 [Tirmania nivea]
MPRHSTGEAEQTPGKYCKGVRPSEGPLSAQLKAEQYHKAVAYLLAQESERGKCSLVLSLEQDSSGQWRLRVLYDYAASPGGDSEPHSGGAGGCAVPKVYQKQLRPPLALPYPKQQQLLSCLERYITPRRSWRLRGEGRSEYEDACQWVSRCHCKFVRLLLIEMGRRQRGLGHTSREDPMPQGVAARLCKRCMRSRRLQAAKMGQRRDEKAILRTEQPASPNQTSSLGKQS